MKHETLIFPPISTNPSLFPSVLRQFPMQLASFVLVTIVRAFNLFVAFIGEDVCKKLTEMPAEDIKIYLNLCRQGNCLFDCSQFNCLFDCSQFNINILVALGKYLCMVSSEAIFQVKDIHLDIP